ncbi:MAG: rubredoxin, partial [Raoultibacter sp.]
MAKYVCQICNYVYDEALGIPDEGIAPGTTWEELPDDWTCPLCGAPKADFEKEETAVPVAASVPASPAETSSAAAQDMRELSVLEMSALCSNLARGCEKQYLAREAELFTQLADYFKSHAPAEES